MIVGDALLIVAGLFAQAVRERRLRCLPRPVRARGGRGADRGRKGPVVTPTVTRRWRKVAREQNSQGVRAESPLAGYKRLQPRSAPSCWARCRRGRSVSVISSIATSTLWTLATSAKSPASSEPSSGCSASATRVRLSEGHEPVAERRKVSHMRLLGRPYSASQFPFSVTETGDGWGPF